MTSFSSILDISSFFIGVLVNLLLVAMICFYFKRKIDNLELSQSEQAKMLFKLLQDQNNAMMAQSATQQGPSSYAMLDGLDLTQLHPTENSGEDENSDSESDDDSDNSDNEEDEPQEQETKTIEYEDNTNHESDEEPSAEAFSKMTVKDLKTYLEDKGYSLSRNMKKQELVDLIMIHQKQQTIDSVVKVDNDEPSEEEVEEVEVQDVITEVNVSDEVELSNGEIVDIEWMNIERIIWKNKNIHINYMNNHSFPIIMEDSRILTDYTPSGMKEQRIQQQQNIKSNAIYRRYLVNNANEIMGINKNTSMQQNVPMLFPQINRQPIHPVLFDGKPIGPNDMPPGYQTNSVKSKYLSAQELNAKKVNKYKTCNV